jgi:Spy/CpxP family protein refolding chaperone
MKIKWLIIPLAAATLAGGFLATKTFAASDSDTNATSTLHSGPRFGRILQRVADRLNLTTDQRSQIQGIIAGDKDNLKTLLQQLHDARINLRTTIQTDGATEADVRAASSKVAGVEADLAVEWLKLFGKISPILTGEQRAKLTELEQNFDSLVDNLIARPGNTEP